MSSPDVSGLPEPGTRAKAIVVRTDRLVERGRNSGPLHNDMQAAWPASAFCDLAEAAWELTLEGCIGAGRAPDFVDAILLHGATA
ncbi:pyrimidine deaminase RibD-like protein [Streptomyces griseochromogenes]|uniref:Pyrimidine deaminase RibD-like protein n=1 Tax=Streptomyces griseochromogenes TaxID=68214 RepID=A0A1B1B084_9ACTN|nr:hypothetical protein [Streptomyces griseochromogenes]ANP52236.1 hypothetical protein AVL59_24175 [Streptomyces griseochromogenes]MBP2055666.1 pyrimidine deaminase RibD-like protein [Streptomyces griseochromogenes]